jgi:hypothetical protein
MLHILLLPLIAAAHAGRWSYAHVLAPFRIGLTAKDIVEEEVGCYGGLAYLIFKVSRLIVESWPLFEPRWLAGRIARGIALAVALIVSAWLLTCMYVGLLIPIVDLDVSRLGLMLSPLVGWVVLGYVLLAEHVRARRAELEAQTGEGD